MKISIHAPARGATGRQVVVFRREIFQSTLPRGERPASCTACSGVRPISIHAPARGATRTSCRYTHPADISIHAPARGATCLLLGNESRGKFQSTLPRGERQSHPHPARQRRKFQSTLPRGERRNLCGEPLKDGDFNPRSREGSDLPHFHRFFLPPHFNPRSREGSDDRRSPG